MATYLLVFLLYFLLYFYMYNISILYFLSPPQACPEDLFSLSLKGINKINEKKNKKGLTELPLIQRELSDTLTLRGRRNEDCSLFRPKDEESLLPRTPSSPA